MIHYTYKITNVITGKQYIGIRSCKGHPLDDIGVKYFSSSSNDEFRKKQQTNPEEFEYSIINIFETRDEAAEDEIFLHELFSVDINEDFYNMSKSTSTGFSICWTGRKRPEHSERMKGERNPFYNKKHSEETIKIISEKATGRKLPPASDERKEKVRKALKGKKRPEKVKQAMRDAAAKRSIRKCPHCGLEGKGGNMTRWHFDNCRYKNA